MTVIFQINNKKLVVETVSGPSSYSTGGFPITFRELQRVEEIIGAWANTGLLVEAHIPSASGNLASVRVYWQTGVSGAPMTEVASGTDLSGVTFKVLAWGY